MVRLRRHHRDDLCRLGCHAVSLQIAKLILYSRRGEVREVAFRPGGLNILTGASKTGKSAIIDIVDYCTGRSKCNVADGAIRKYVGWYALLFQLGDGQILIARRNPDVGDRTNGDIYMDRGSDVETPPESALFKNTTVGCQRTNTELAGARAGHPGASHRAPHTERRVSTAGEPSC